MLHVHHKYARSWPLDYESIVYTCTSESRLCLARFSAMHDSNNIVSFDYDL